MLSFSFMIFFSPSPSLCSFVLFFLLDLVFYRRYFIPFYFSLYLFLPSYRAADTFTPPSLPSTPPPFHTAQGLTDTHTLPTVSPSLHTPYTLYHPGTPKTEEKKEKKKQLHLSVRLQTDTLHSACTSCTSVHKKLLSQKKRHGSDCEVQRGATGGFEMCLLVKEAVIRTGEGTC